MSAGRTISIMVCSLVAASLLMSVASPVLAEETTGPLKSTVEASSLERIDEIDRSLLLAFIKFARFNIQFHNKANWQPTWRAIAYPLGREAGTAVAFASSIMELRLRYFALEHPKRVTKRAVRDVLNVALVGTLISGSVSSVQLAQNTWVAMRAKEAGYSPRETLAFVKEVVASTDGLFAERASLVADTPVEGRRQVLELEDRLLYRIRQQLLYEFATWSAHSRDTMWRQNSFYALDAAQNYARATGVMVGLRALNHPRLGGHSAITTLAANGVATVDPILSVVAGLAVRKYQLNKLAREFDIRRPESPEGESWDQLTQKLAELKRDAPSERRVKLLGEAGKLAEGSQMLDTSLDRETKRVEQLRQIAQQQMFVGPAIGLSGVAGSTIGTIAFYGYRGHRTSTAHLLLGTRLTVMAGQSVALTYTPAAVILALRKAARLKRRGELPQQLLAQRLKNLDDLEAQIKATK